LLDRGVYWESIGPRFETTAEIRLIAPQADVIGMTIASECVSAGELGLPYAAVCIVDNLANGVGERELTVEEFQAGRERNRERLGAAMSAIVPALAAEAL
jgi:5'-methylthioadenosine phosphorylase